MPGVPVVEAIQSSIRIGYREIVAPFSVTICTGEFWLFHGPNGSGKSLVAELLSGRRAAHRGTIRWSKAGGGRPDVELVSFEEIERLLAQERRQDMSSILHGAVDPGRTLRMLLEADDIDVSDPDVCALCGQLGLGHILERGLRFLSTGEIRKSLLARALAKDPRLLVIDDPFDGLDRDSQSELSRVIHRAATGERAIVIVGGRARDRLPEVTHELQIDGGVVQYAGPLRSAASESADLVASHPHFQIPAVVTDAQKHAETGTELISMNDVFVSYGSTPILRNIDWSVRAGTHWMVFGPNGSGKSTLLSLVSGENPKAYGQQIELFGRRRGSGESVAEIRRHIEIGRAHV